MTDRAPEILPDEDAALAARAAEGDRAAFEALVRKYQGAIFSFAYHFFRSPDVAEDIAQETFLRAYRFLGSYDPSRRFLTWLYSISRNLCIDKHRERARKEFVGLDDLPQHYLCSERADGDPLGMLELRENRRALAEAIENLPEKYRTPVILCYLQGLPYQEVGEILGISLNNTKIRIFRAKKMILESLGYGDEP